MTFNRHQRSLSLVSALGVATLLLIAGYYEFNFWGLSNSLIHSYYGHILVYEKDYKQRQDIDPFAVSIDAMTIENLKKEAGVELVAPRSIAFGTLDASHAVEIHGVDIEAEHELFTFVSSQKGRWFLEPDKAEVVISQVLSEKVKKGVGESLTLTVTTQSGEVNAVSFEICGVFSSYSQEIDQTSVRISKKSFDRLFESNQVHEVSLVLTDANQIGATAKRLSESALYKNVVVIPWYEEVTYFNQVVGFLQAYFYLVLAITTLVVAGISFALVSRILSEKRIVMGTERALGLSKRLLLIRTSGEFALPLVLGLVIGWIISLGLALANQALGGLPMPKAPGTVGDIRILFMFSAQGFWFGILCSVVVPYLLGLYLTLRSSKRAINELLERRES